MNQIAEVKEYWDARPCNIRHSRKEVGTKEYFDEVEKRRYFVEPHIKDFCQVERWRGKKVLEIGCGLGVDAINYARAGADVTIVDLSQKSLDLCQHHFEVNDLKARFFCGSAEELSSFVPVEQFDLIYSFGVIHHTPHPEKVFAELKKYCHAATELRMMLYAKWSWKVFWIIMTYGKGAFWKADELIRTYSEAQVGCPVTFCYSARELKDLLKGYELVQLSKDHIFPYVIKKYVNYQYEYVWYFRYLPQPVFKWLKKCLGWHWMIVAKLKNK